MSISGDPLSSNFNLVNPEVRLSLEEVKEDPVLQFEEAHIEGTPYAKMEELIRESLDRLKIDQPNATRKDLEIICEIETSKYGDAIIGVSKNSGKNNDYYKGNIILRVTNKEGVELAKSKLTIYPPRSISLAHYDEEENAKTIQKTIQFNQYYCDLIKDACNQKLSDEKTKVVIQSVKTGFVVAPDYILNPEKYKFPERNVVVLKDNSDNSDQSLSETATLSDKIYRNNKWEYRPSKRPMYFNAQYRSAGEYMPKYIMQSDFAIGMLSRSSPEEQKEKILEDRGLLPDLLKYVRQEGNRTFRRFKDIQFRLVDLEKNPTAGLKQYFMRTKALEEKNEKNLVPDDANFFAIETRLKKAEKDLEIEQDRDVVDRERMEQLTQEVAKASKELSDVNKKIFNDLRPYEIDLQDLDQIIDDFIYERVRLRYLSKQSDLKLDENEKSSIEREITVLNEKMGEIEELLGIVRVVKNTSA